MGTAARQNEDDCSHRSRPSVDTVLTPRNAFGGDEQLTASSSSSRSTAASSSSAISPSSVDRSFSMPSPLASSLSSPHHSLCQTGRLLLRDCPHTSDSSAESRRSKE